jgi:hypothetical protein
MPARRKDMLGKCFGRLVAMEPSAVRRYGSVEWLCSCVCGQTVFVTLDKVVK